jgi:hypothetical protein
MNANAQTGDTPDAVRLRALLSQLNWLNALNNEPANGVYEYQFYSDAHITGEFTSGLDPYSFLNTVPIPDTPGIVTAQSFYAWSIISLNIDRTCQKRTRRFITVGRWLMNLLH